jgi:hypothetical protein
LTFKLLVYTCAAASSLANEDAVGRGGKIDLILSAVVYTAQRGTYI